MTKDKIKKFILDEFNSGFYVVRGANGLYFEGYAGEHTKFFESYIVNLSGIDARKLYNKLLLFCAYNNILVERTIAGFGGYSIKLKYSKEKRGDNET